MRAQKLLILFSAVAVFFLFSSISFAFKGSGNDKTIFLTFDDGPKPDILKDLLPVLEKFNTPAAFFVIGSSCVSHRDLLNILRRSGHSVENHGWGHENLLRQKKARRDWRESTIRSIEKTSAIISNSTGREPHFFRPPFWAIDEEIKETVAAMGYVVMRIGDPDINTLDYEDAAKKRPESHLVARVKEMVSSREKKDKFSHVLVFHELRVSVKALEVLIPYFLSKGYRFCHINEITQGGGK